MRNSPTRRAFVKAVGQSAAAALLAGPRSGIAAESSPAPRDLPRDLTPTGANLGSAHAPIERIAEHIPFAYSFLGDRFRTLAEFKEAGRAKVLEVLGTPPPAVEPRPDVVDRADCGDFIREKVVFSTTPYFRVPAYVLVPKGLRRPAPAILDLHSHGGRFLFGKEKVVDLGTNHPAMEEYHRTNYDGRPTATALVRRGYVVISIDAFPFGERRIMLDADAKYGWDRANYSMADVAYLNGRSGREATIVKGLALAGQTWPGVIMWDDMRTVDYLVQRPEVDAQRIGCLGISMGGHRSLFLAGLDERIAAACVAGFMSTVRPMIKAHLDTHSNVHFVPQLHRWLDLPDVVSMMAPKPLLVLQCSRDALFPLAGMKESVAKIAAVYAKAGAAGGFSGRFHDVPHRFTQAMQNEAFAWLDQHLRPGE